MGLVSKFAVGGIAEIETAGAEPPAVPEILEQAGAVKTVSTSCAASGAAFTPDP